MKEKNTKPEMVNIISDNGSKMIERAQIGWKPEFLGIPGGTIDGTLIQYRFVVSQIFLNYRINYAPPVLMHHSWHRAGKQTGVNDEGWQIGDKEVWSLEHQYLDPWIEFSGLWAHLRVVLLWWMRSGFRWCLFYCSVN